MDSLIQHVRAVDAIGEFLSDFPAVRRKQAEAFLSLALNDALELVPHDEQTAEDAH